MNYLYFSKKLNLFSGYLNLFSSFGWITLVFLIGYYHFYILNDPLRAYNFYSSLPNKSFFLNPFDNIKVSTPVASVQPTNMYAYYFIEKNGYSSFFSEITHFLWGKHSYWKLIQPIFIGSIIASSCNLGFSIVSIFCSFKGRSFNYLISSLANLFIPVWGGVLTLKIHNQFKLLIGSGERFRKIISPGQFIKFRTKLLLQKIFSEIVVPA